ncbi:Hypothetical predicted protein [Paramuricea clavata]|uniref:Uncharacterized protein n=1 Tax=Paramuricea clavata TaxID=317549 RepID=A0A6S7GM72_PARCT|nr:Hypothetical predicted protein [Paramuricea clavata]
MDRVLLTSCQAAGVNESVISILEDEEFDTADILNNTSDDLLRACNIKGGQIVRIRKALEDLEVCQVRITNLYY